uniref:Uncharacterized protein n=1 Tax=Acanthochromis polyacanthus TaxID=80966 RepID=A0A3Q1G2Q3_9TELE
SNRWTSLQYEAEESSNVTVEWSFTSTAGLSISSLKIHCVLLPDLQVFYHLDNSTEEKDARSFNCEQTLPAQVNDSPVCSTAAPVRATPSTETPEPGRAVRPLLLVAMAAGMVVLLTPCCLVLHRHPT